MPSWICCQLGAREHYAIPRSLHQHNQLAHLITDAWVPPASPIARLPLNSLQPLRDRHHSDLAQAPVQSFTPQLIAFEAQQRFRKTGGWPRILDRNRWFQRRAVSALRQIARKGSDRPILFTYSYAALELFRYAKTQGWYCILGQIDPGPVEEEIVLKEQSKYPGYQPNWETAPQSYWANWREECELADRILVNSSWASSALQQAGIDNHKLRVVPLAYQTPAAAQSFTRQYPEQFSSDRPLRVLFLGQIILRKGLMPLLEAAKLLHDQPIEFWMVGASNLNLPEAITNLKNIWWMGPVPRSGTASCYQQADVFLFPTLSDGFGLTQLEAQAWQLPIIASGRCGDVVKDQINGVTLTHVSGEAIADVLRFCLKEPQRLQQWSERCSLEGFSLQDLQFRLAALLG
jgi:glycosyltransferase involved in cell wall biosynthesis